ncbi:MAG: hypothetical protein ICV84_24270 [Flavisolibacter sp.]|nr:hypothetical protein [Flavisolibacter sp.]
MQNLAVLSIFLQTKTALGKSALLIACLLIFLRPGAQQARPPVNNVYTRLGAYSRLHTDVFSFRANQAGLATIQSFAAGVYGERRFLLRELAFYSAAIALPTSTGTFGLNGTYYGNAAYNEAQAGLAYGRRLGDKISIGAQFNYYSFRVAGYDHATAVNAEAGFLIHITDQLHAGVHVYNPTNSKWNKAEHEKIPAIYSAGFGFDASDKFTLYTEAQKITGENLGINAGLQYKFTDQLLARGGFASATSTYYFGLGVWFKTLRLDATASIHPQLGLTPGLLLIFETKKQNP